MSNAPDVRKTKRRRLFWAAATGFLLLLAGIVAYAWLIEPRWIKVTCADVPVAHLGPGWEGARAAHLSDLHLGPYVDIARIRRVVDMTLAEKPDLILLTGDYVSRTRVIGPELGGELARLRAPMGVFAVLGNHDHWTDAAAVTAMLRDAGITVLTNAGVTLERGGSRLCIAGVDDLWEGEQRLDAALADVPDDVPRVLLCHNPDYADVMPASPRVDLMLSGHTHGGQIKIPFGPRPRLPVRDAKYAAGLNPGPHCPVFTSVGLGQVTPPVRFNCRPEIVILTLRGR